MLQLLMLFLLSQLIISEREESAGVSAEQVFTLRRRSRSFKITDSVFRIQVALLPLSLWPNYLEYRRPLPEVGLYSE